MEININKILEEKKKLNNNVLVLDLGSTNDCRKEWISLDIQGESVDIIHDLEIIPLPFENNTFDCINASHILEHIHNLIPLMNDLWRIIKEEGVLLIKVPAANTPAAIIDPTHVRMFHPDTIAFFTPAWPFYKNPQVKKWDLRKRVISAEIMWALTPIKGEPKERIEPIILPDGFATPANPVGDSPWFAGFC